MKQFLNKVIKVKHVLIGLILVLGMAVGFAMKRPHFRPKRQMSRVEHRQPMKRDFHNLSDVEKGAIDSLKSLMVRGDRENNKVIFTQIREIVKKGD